MNKVSGSLRTRRLSPGWATVIGSTALLLVVAACGNGSEGEGDSNGSQVAKVGLITPTSTAVAFAGEPVEKGAQLAAKEINESGFLGSITLELASEDSRNDPARAVSLYRSFAGEDYSAIVCCVISNETGSVKGLVAESKIPTVVALSPLEGMSEPPYLYRTTLLPDLPGGMYEQVIDATTEAMDLQTGIVVTTADNESVAHAGEVFSARMEVDGVEVGNIIETFAADTDFAGPASEIVAEDPDVVVMSMLGNGAAGLTKALRDRDYEGQIVSNYGIAPLSIYEQTGPAIGGAIFPIPFTPLTDDPGGANFTKLYRDAYKEEPDVFAASGYNAIWFIAQGIKESRSTDPKDLAMALEEIRSFGSAFGTITMNEEGQAESSKPVDLVQWNEDGTQELWMP